MFLSAIVKAHSDGRVDPVQEDAADEAAASRTSDDVNADAIAALEKRLIELPATHRARWL